MELPNITIKKVVENHNNWGHLIDTLIYFKDLQISYEERLILENFCNSLAGKKRLFNWREMEQTELISWSLVYIEEELKRRRHIEIVNQ